MRVAGERNKGDSESNVPKPHKAIDKIAQSIAAAARSPLWRRSMRS
jgi:hypothetical protein